MIHPRWHFQSCHCFFLSLPSLCQWQVQTVRVLLPRKAAQRLSARRWPKIRTFQEGCMCSWRDGILQSRWTCLPTGQCGTCRKASIGVWLHTLSWRSPTGHKAFRALCPKPKGTIHPGMEVAQLRGATPLPLVAHCPVAFLPQLGLTQIHVPEGSSVWGLRFLKPAVRKKNPSKMPNQKEMKSYKQKLVSFAQFSFITAEAIRGNLAAAGWCARGTARHPWLHDCSVKTDMSTIFSGVPAVILLRQTGLFPFHAQFACLFFQKEEVGFFVLYASL